MQAFARSYHSLATRIAVAASALVTLAGPACSQVPDFRALVEGFTSTLPVQADGKVLVGGNFTRVAGQKRSNIARLGPDAILDGAFDPGGSNSIAALIVQTDGKIVVGGSFTNLAGLSRNRIGRLNPDGSLDTAFDPGANDSILCFALQNDGKILVGGSFTTLGGQPRDRLGRLNADGSLDSGFNPGISVQGCYPCIPPSVNTLALQPDAKILVGGDFTTVGGLIRSNLARLNANGTLDTAFRPPIDFPVNCLAVQADGSILAGGGYNTSFYWGYTNGNLVRLQPSRTLDAKFNAAINSEVSSLALQTDGKVLIGGTFTSVGGQWRTNVARLNPDGTLDTGFNARIYWPLQSPQTIFQDFPL